MRIAYTEVFKEVYGYLRAVLKTNEISERALELTNEFRKKNGLPPVQWSQELCDIGMNHSRDMGEGRVPFGHQGFDKRCKQVYVDKSRIR